MLVKVQGGKCHVDGEIGKGKKDGEGSKQTYEGERDVEKAHENSESGGGNEGGDVADAELEADQCEQSDEVCASNDNTNTQEDSSPIANQVDSGRSDTGREVGAEEGLAVDVDMVDEEDSLKVARQKRKSKNTITGSQAKKVTVGKENLKKQSKQKSTGSDFSSEDESGDWETGVSVDGEKKMLMGWRK